MNPQLGDLVRLRLWTLPLKYIEGTFLGIDGRAQHVVEDDMGFIHYGKVTEVIEKWECRTGEEQR
jgi:hypothetical protein